MFPKEAESISTGPMERKNMPPRVHVAREVMKDLNEDVSVAVGRSAVSSSGSSLIELEVGRR